MTRAARLGLAALLVVGGVSFVVVVLVPPGPTVVDAGNSLAEDGQPVVAGAFHVHTRRSDGAGTPDEVAAAAARAGLQFVMFADHGNGMRPPDPPRYLHGVLCLDGIEVSTTGGHYVVVGLRAPTPYPLAGEPQDVAEDVARLGGFGVAAHPTSAKPALAWADWSVPIDGLEWLNADSEWRDESWRTLAVAPLAYVLRPAAALARLLDRPTLALTRWDALTVRRRVVAIAASDAHGRIDLAGDPRLDGTSRALKIPSYEASFRAFAVRVELDAPPSGRADADADALLRAIRTGRVYSAIDALARPVRFAFTARTAGGEVARMGDTVRADGPVVLRARVRAPAGSEIVLVRDGREVARTRGEELLHDTTVGQGAFRVEVHVPGAPGDPPVPWIVSNPIYVGPRRGEGDIPPRMPPAVTEEIERVGEAGEWVVERDPASTASVIRSGARSGELVFRYALGGGRPFNQYAALVRRTARGALGGYDRLMFRARSSRPARVEVQVRQSGEPDGVRWQRSVYLDEAPRAVAVFFDEMTPIGHSRSWKPDLSQVDAVLLVVDTTHTVPGTTGVLWLEDVRLARAGATPESETRPPGR